MTAITDESKCSSSWLKQSLSKRASSLFKRYIALEKRLADDVLPFTNLPDFTDHGLKHAKAVQFNLASMIPQNMPESLNPFEIFSLLVATMLHDVGMAISKSQDEPARNLRMDHYNRSREFMLKNHEALNMSENEAFIIGEICRAHGMPNLSYLEKEPFSLARHGNIRVPLLSALLRLADALDVTAYRAPYLIAKNRVMTQESRRHWNLHKSISGVQIKTAPSWDIIISAIPRKKSHELDLYKLRNSIQNELDTISPVLRAAGIFFKKVDLVMNSLLLKKSKRTLKNPFFIRLDSFNQRYSHLFAGREEEIEQLFELILGRKLVLLIGESGVGKTSLVEAGVVPKLKSYGFGIVRFSFQNDPIGNLIVNLNNFSQPQSTAKHKTIHSSRDLRNLLGTIQEALSKLKKKVSKLIIIGDHLEQMFTVSMDQKVREDLIVQFSRVLGNLSPNPVTFLFCIRQDYLPELYELSHYIPEIYKRENIFKVHRLSREKGKKVLERGSEYARVKLPNHLIERVVDDLCEEGEGMVYPPFLQIVGYYLYAEINRGHYLDGFNEVPKAFYEKLGRVESIVKRYLDTLLDNFSQEDKALVGEILATMITEYYTKRRVTLKELKHTLPHCNKMEDLLKILIQHRIIRRSLGEYELISDFLAHRVIELVRSRTFLSPPVRKALRFIEKNYHRQGLTSGEIAAAAGVTQIHLAALFSRQLGRTINNQLNTIRITKAKEMLGKNRDPIAKVAEQAGYMSLSSFSRKFKEIDGVSPLAYRSVLMETQQVSNRLGQFKRS